MNTDTIKSMSQELNGLICYGGLFEKTAYADTAGSIAGGLGGAALGGGISHLVMEAISKKTPSKTLALLGGTAALLPFVAIGSSAGRKIQQENRKSRREEMVMKELMKNPAFRDRIASASRGRDTIKVSMAKEIGKRAGPGLWSRLFGRAGTPAKKQITDLEFKNLMRYQEPGRVSTAITQKAQLKRAPGPTPGLRALA